MRELTEKDFERAMSRALDMVVEFTGRRTARAE